MIVIERDKIMFTDVISENLVDQIMIFLVRIVHHNLNRKEIRLSISLFVKSIINQVLSKQANQEFIGEKFQV